MSKEELIKQLRSAFATIQYPGDSFLQGSFDGCEPLEEVSAFFGKHDWSLLDSGFLDQHYCALSFFSAAGFRFYLPAYLIADVKEELVTAEPLFHLWHGFSTVTSEVKAGTEIFRRKSGGNTFVNPKRYGAMTWSEDARHRLSVFTREEAKAIVSYLNHKERKPDANGPDKARIEAALSEYWIERAEKAPTRDQLEAHLRAEEKFVEALRRSKKSDEASG